ncbi:hypothetical protein IQ06DRAFT_300454 [Phaeosphaeriaceae sp. SRC1lsM3a]|nr:hypothetical protein IQ06DRAFT_300454 [Stagonospora sp. SRC1lsM3a]
MAKPTSHSRIRIPGAYIHSPESESEHSDSSEDSVMTETEPHERASQAKVSRPSRDANQSASTETVLAASTGLDTGTKVEQAHKVIIPSNQIESLLTTPQSTNEALETHPPPDVSETSVTSSQRTGFPSSLFSQEDFQYLGPAVIGTTPGASSGPSLADALSSGRVGPIHGPSPSAIGPVHELERTYKVRMQSKDFMPTRNNDHGIAEQEREAATQTTNPSAGTQTENICSGVSALPTGSMFSGNMGVPSKRIAQTSDIPPSRDTSAPTVTQHSRPRPKINLPKEFLASVQKKVVFPKAAYEAINEPVEDVFRKFTSFTDNVANHTRADEEYKTHIAECEEDLARFRAMPTTPHAILIRERRNQMEQLRKLKEELKHSRTTNAMSYKSLLDSYIDGMVDSIATIVVNAHLQPVLPEPSELEELYYLRAKKEEFVAHEAKLLELGKSVQVARAGAEARLKIIDRLEAEAKAYQKKAAAEIKELHSTHRSNMKTRLSECARDQEAALRRVKELYACRLDDAEAKLREQKKAIAQIGDMERHVQQVEREKSEVILAKSAVEKELYDLAERSKTMESYKDAYQQIKAEYDQLQGEYNDAAAERDGLLACVNEPVNQTLEAYEAVTSKLHASTLRSIDNDLEMREAFWQQQEDFAEIARRKKLMEIEEADWEIEGMKKQIQALEQSKGLLSNKSDDSDQGGEEEEEMDTISQPSTENAPRHLLHTLAQHLAPVQGNSTSQQQTVASESTRQPPQEAPTGRTTWAKKAANGKPDPRQECVHGTNQGDGVTTVRRKDNKNKVGIAADHQRNPSGRGGRR